MSDSGDGQQQSPELDRQTMEVDVVCVGFGPAAGGFLTTLSHHLADPDQSTKLVSSAMPGMPLQVICYERADDVGFGVSGVVTRGREIRNSFPEFDPAQIPMATGVTEERLVYLLDPVGASRRSSTLRVFDRSIRALKGVLPFENEAFNLPYIPAFLRKEEGFVFSIGQFNQWVGAQLMSSGAVQVWPGTPVGKPLIEADQVKGVRLLDQGTDRQGNPADGYMPGMDIRAALTVVADGPVGAVGTELDEHFGMPEDHHHHEWAVGAKMVVSLREGVDLKPGTVFHTFGYPEPEIFGFMYVYPDNLVSLGIFVPSSFGSPVRNSYRYLQHWMMHPYIWRYLEGGTLRSWGAKSLQESGRFGEPHLVGNGYARIGEGSGSTNMLTGSGVDEAWTTGVQLAEGVVELAKAGKPFTRENLEAAYVRRRRESWLDKELRAAEKARVGFMRGLIPGMLGMALAGFTKGKLAFPGKTVPPHEQLRSLEDFYRGRISGEEIEELRQESSKQSVPLHELLMKRLGWPEIPYDGKLLMSQQDALLLGGKVQAAPGYADHVEFIHPELCESCGEKVCIEMCSGQAIAHGDGGRPAFDREKCVHCGACLWNCAEPLPENSQRTNIRFRSGSGGLHSAEN